MNKWWKNPVLQGEENDYGQYDYLINPLPQNRHEWIKGECHCDSCGKYRHLSVRDTAYFYTLDGYDSLDCTECWICVLTSKIHTKIHRLKKPFKNAKFLWEQRKWVYHLWKALKRQGATNKHCVNTILGLLPKGVQP